MKKIIKKLTEKTVNEPYYTGTNIHKLMLTAILAAIIGILFALYFNNFYLL